MLIGSADLQTCKDICASLDKRFKLKASSDVASFLGLELLFQDGLLHIHQRNKINELATHFNIVHGVNVDYPMKDNVDFDTGQSALLEEVVTYQSLQTNSYFKDSLIYLTTIKESIVLIKDYTPKLNKHRNTKNKNKDVKIKLL